MTFLAQNSGEGCVQKGAPAGDPAPHLSAVEFSMLGGARIMSSAADAERSARLISWLCALVSGRDPKLL